MQAPFNIPWDLTPTGGSFTSRRRAGKSRIIVHIVRRVSQLDSDGFVLGTTLFRRSTSEGTIFGDLGGRSDVPIWEDTCVLLYDKLRGRIDFKREIMSRLYVMLESQGVCSRFSFYGNYYRPQKENIL